MKTFTKALCALLLTGLAIGAIVGQSGASGYGGSTKKPKLDLSVPKGQTTTSARKHGLKVKASCNVSCVVKLTAVKGGKTLGKGHKALSGKKGTVKIKFNKKGKKALKAGSLTFTVKGFSKNGSGKKSKVADQKVTLHS